MSGGWIAVALVVGAFAFVLALTFGEAWMTNKRWRVEAEALDGTFSPEKLRSEPEIAATIRGVDVVVTKRQIGHKETAQFFIRFELRGPPNSPPFRLSSRKTVSYVKNKLGVGDNDGLGDRRLDDLAELEYGRADVFSAEAAGQRRRAAFRLFDSYKNVNLSQETLVAEVKDTARSAQSIASTATRLVDVAHEIWGPAEGS